MKNIKMKKESKKERGNPFFIFIFIFIYFYLI
jgi:hypothetical protein